jgi:Nif-specific regulatory protein
LVWIGKSQHTTDLRRNILKLKDISTPICIEGEKGVGKSLYAHILHAEGARGINEIYEVDCLTTKAEEFDELFWGSAKGPGIFSVCKDGSVVFREVKEISLKGQEKILSEFMGKNPNSNRLRFFFTSSISLDDLREDGVISQDFYTFINQNIVEIKPLRERKKDIEELVDYFLSRECKDQGFLQKVFSDKIKDSLVEYEWQGNTSELKTAIARLVRYNPKSHVIVEVEDSILPILKAPVNSRISSEIAHVNDHTLHLKDRILLVEYEMIKAEIKRHKGNKSQAAISMGISREALRKKLMNCESITTKVEEVVRNKRKSNIDEKTRVINLADLKKAA